MIGLIVHLTALILPSPAAAAGAPGTATAAGPQAAPPPPASTPAATAEVRVEGSHILVNNEVFEVRGAAGAGRLDLLAGLGATTIRTYGGDPGPILDAAQKAGLKVIAGLWLSHPRLGADYADPAFVERQLAEFRATVEKYRDHPALLMWGIGNEVEVDLADDSKVWPEVERVAALVRRLDPAHPTLAVLAELGEGKVARLKAAAPSIQVLGVNSYGDALLSLPARARQAGWTAPLLVTEMGALGQWQAATTPWGAPFEPSSTQKAIQLRRYLAALKAGGAGPFPFLWGQKQEVTPSWHSLFLTTGEWTEALESMAENWGGQAPGGNHAPRIATLVVAGNESAPFGSWRLGSTGEVRIKAVDPDGDPLAAHWSIREESTARSVGGDPEVVPPAHPEGLKSGDLDGAVVSGLPIGHYRLFVEIRDGRGAAATANLPLEIHDRPD
ncbi:glycoside hydrolase 5 family protein [Ancylobacter lacus]|uniref:glycosyl hydrolase n=1 Tax=Ancylobacter lacus TaxID=2579970 RepID=UPI001FEB67B7|nr:glycosyl hydrolase [Ancylobacter lacus]